MDYNGAFNSILDLLKRNVMKIASATVTFNSILDLLPSWARLVFEALGLSILS